MSQQSLLQATRLPKTPLLHRAERHRTEQRLPQLLTQYDCIGGSENLQACFTRRDAQQERNAA